MNCWQPGLLALLLACGSAVGAPDAAGLRWEKSDDSVALVRGEHTVWRYNYGREQAKPCFHPLTVQGGPDLTSFRPEDHRWHRGLWFSWKFINGVNYWEEDPATGNSEGQTELKESRIETRPDFSARIEQRLEYHPAEGRPALREDRLVQVSAPDATGAYSLDWQMRFIAMTNTVLDRTPLPEEPDGMPYGGYAGLSVRLTGDLRQVIATTTNGPVTFTAERFRGKSMGMDYSGSLAGRDYGIAILDHPDNLNAPSPWYAIHGPIMRYFSPAVLCYGPHIMKTGDALALRYRVVVHPERWDTDRLVQEWRRHSNPE